MTERNVNPQIRPFDAGRDYEAIAEIFRQTFPGFPGTAASMRESDLRPMMSGPRGRFVAEVDGQVVGVSQYQPNIAVHQLGIRAAVLPALQRRGVGSALYQAALEGALAHRPESLWTEVPEPNADALAFVLKRGFVRHTCVFESRFDLTRTSDEKLAALIPESFRRSGLGFETLDRTSVPDAVHQFYELYCASMKDVPNLPEGELPSFEDFQLKYLGPARSPGDCILLAVDSKAGPGLAGFSQMMINQAMPGMALIAMTGCDRRFRGQGVATALKVEAMRRAKRRGLETLSTWNDAINAPILAINEKLGFERRPGTWVLRRPVP